MLLLLFLVLGALFAGAIGLLLGSIFKTQSAPVALTGISSLLFVVPSFFVGPVGHLVQGSGVVGEIMTVYCHRKARPSIRRKWKDRLDLPETGLLRKVSLP